MRPSARGIVAQSAFLPMDRAMKAATVAVHTCADKAEHSTVHSSDTAFRKTKHAQCRGLVQSPSNLTWESDY